MPDAAPTDPIPPAGAPSSTAGALGVRVVVVGAGIVGACCAVALVRAGCRVVLLDPAPPGGPQAASHGNGGWISPASVVPMASPGLWRRVPGLLADRDGPLVLRPSAVPALAPWLWRFLRAGGTPQRVRVTSDRLAELLRDAPMRHRRLAQAAGVPQLVRGDGLLYAYADDTAWSADAAAWALRRRAGVAWRTVDPTTAWPVVPPGAARQRLGAWVPAAAHCHDPGGYVAALVDHARALGAVLHRGRVVGCDVDGDSVVAVRWVPVADEGEPSSAVRREACDRVVLAAGIGSGPLARALGVAVPMASERGYHIELPVDPSHAQRWAGLPPVMPAAGRMAVTPMAGGLRLAGQVELAAVDAPPDWRRADVLWRHAARWLDDETWAATGLAMHRHEPTVPAGVRRWMGHRPSTADGLPVIGPVHGRPSVVCAFGHGHTGLAMAPVTAQAVVHAVTGADAPPPPLAEALAACSPSRFG